MHREFFNDGSLCEEVDMQSASYLLNYLNYIRASWGAGADDDGHKKRDCDNLFQHLNFSPLNRLVMLYSDNCLQILFRRLTSLADFKFR